MAWALTGVLLIGAAILRCVGLEHNPPGLWQDEASTGLDAYLLWTTGRDQSGAFLPLIARSFGDYPLAGYRYLAAPFVGLLGPSPGTERMPAAAAGTLLVAVTALWIRRRPALADVARPAMPATVAILALSPMALFFSRYGSEAILMPACLMTGAWLAEGRRPAAWRMWASALAIGLSAYTYHAVKVFLPLWLLLFAAYRWDEGVRTWRERRVHLVGPALLFAGLVLPSVGLAFTRGGMARPDAVVAWAHHPYPRFIWVIVNNTLSYFDPGFLFVRGGPHVVQSVPGLGIYNLIELPLAAWGLRLLWRLDQRAFGFWLGWFLIGPIPGGLTYETQNVGRSIGWLPAVPLLAGLGLAGAWLAPLRGPGKTLLQIGLLGALGATGVAVVHGFFVRFPNVAPSAFQYEIGATLECARRNRGDGKVFVSPRIHYAKTFGRFYFEPLAQKEGLDALTFEDPRTLPPGAVYAAPRDARPPARGIVICSIHLPGSNHVVGRVFRGRPDSDLPNEPTAPGPVLEDAPSKERLRTEPPRPPRTPTDPGWMPEKRLDPTWTPSTGDAPPRPGKRSTSGSLQP